ncbi:MAG: redox-sensing transcriptional repressor Rex [Candidatus Omnitrophica bacterium]|nr:redox-sensing transcriptional repressor Rex [Candidatus Omnitrophota bacterium]
MRAIIASRNSILRLSKYKNALNRFQKLGYVRVFSDILADAVGGTSAQVRKDFSLFGIKGNKRGGYNADELLGKLNDILGKNTRQSVIIAGAGKIGMALVKYKGFENEGISIVAAFDIDPAKIRQGGDIPVFPLDELKAFVKTNDIRIGIIAVPDIAAQQVFEIMVSSGIKGVLNFAPIRLKETADVVVNNVNVELELENVIYFVNALERTGSK